MTVLLHLLGCVENGLGEKRPDVGEAAPSIRVDPARLDFGALPVGASSSRSLAVTNEGAAPLTITGVAFAGAPSGAFAIPGAPSGLALGEGESTTFDVVFTSGGARADDDLLVASDDPDQPSLAVPLVGESLRGQLELDPSSVDFGATTAGVPVAATVTLRNVGDDALTVDTLVVSGAAFAAGSLELPLALLPSEAASVDLAFSPPTEGSYEGTLWVTADDAVGTHTAPLAGYAGESMDEGDTGPPVDCTAAGPEWAWVNWKSATLGDPGSAAGELLPASGSVGVAYAGDLTLAQTSGGYDYWVPDAPYLSSVVSNAPATKDILALTGGSASPNQLTFSPAVDCLAVAIVSLGTSSTPVDYVFDAPFQVLSFGEGYFGDGTLEDVGANTLRGREGHGVVLFQGPISELTWTATVWENWHAFTVGVPTESAR